MKKSLRRVVGWILGVSMLCGAILMTAMAEMPEPTTTDGHYIKEV